MSAVAAGIISIIGSLLGGAMKGEEKKNKKSEQKGMINKWKADVKPRLPYYESPYLPTTDKLMMQAVLGNLGKRLGPDELSKWGIDLTQLQKNVNTSSGTDYGMSTILSPSQIQNFSQVPQRGGSITSSAIGSQGGPQGFERQRMMGMGGRGRGPMGPGQRPLNPGDPNFKLTDTAI